MIKFMSALICARFYRDALEPVVLPLIPAIAFAYLAPLEDAQLLVPAFIFGILIINLILVLWRNRRVSDKHVLIFCLSIAAIANACIFIPTI